MLTFRLNRLSFWLVLANIGLVEVILRYFGDSSFTISLAAIFPAVPRLHDIGRTGWIAVAAIAIAYLISATLVLNTRLEATLAPRDITTLLIFGLLSVLGFLPGNLGPNKWGDRPRRGFSYKRT